MLGGKRLGVAGGVFGFGDAGGDFHRLPWLHPMFSRFKSDHWASPAAMTMWIEQMGIGIFQTSLGAGTGGGQRPATLRTSKEKHVSV